MLIPNRLKMGYLLVLVLEMSPLFTLHNQQVLVRIYEIRTKKLTFPTTLLDHYHLTAKSFQRHLYTYLPKVLSTSTHKDYIHLELAAPIQASSGPFFFNIEDHSISFPLHRDLFIPFSEVMIHYLLLYNLCI